MSNQNDPIAQIKKTEEDSNKKIEDSKKGFEEDLLKFSAELEEKTEKFEEDLKEKGMAKLKNVKTEAHELFKTQMATSQNNKSKTIKDAEQKQAEAVKEIESSFMDYIKN